MRCSREPGQTLIRRRSSEGSGGLPLISTRQEKFGGRPDIASSKVSAPIFNGRDKTSSKSVPFAPLETQGEGVQYASHAGITGQGLDERSRDGQALRCAPEVLNQQI